MKDERQYLTTHQPDCVLYHAGRRKLVTARKARLFACGCYRLVWDRITLPSVRHVVEQAEGWADGRVTQAELGQLRYPEGDFRESSDPLLVGSVQSLVTTKPVPGHMAWLIRCVVDPERYERVRGWQDYPPQADLARDLFGNPFRPVAFDPAWRTQTVEALAAGVYADRAFDRLPVLADALDDAGCDAADLLAHLRGDGPHVRGCWALDLVLGKA